eukprot:3436525-Pleurochrysis_carterae.AAC.3
MPYANAEGAGSEEGSRRTAGTGGGGYRSSPAVRKRSCATVLMKEAKVGATGGGGDGCSGCVSRSASATAASPPEGPECPSTSPTRGSKSKLKKPCSGARGPRKAATSGGTWRRCGCTPSRAHRA